MLINVVTVVTGAVWHRAHLSAVHGTVYVTVVNLWPWSLHSNLHKDRRRSNLGASALCSGLGSCSELTGRSSGQTGLTPLKALQDVHHVACCSDRQIALFFLFVLFCYGTQ